MRISYFILFSILILTGCYKDYDNTIEIVTEEIPETTMETGLTGKIITNNLLDIANVRLEANGETLVTGQETFYKPLQLARKKGQLIEMFNGTQLVGVANPFLIENDINYFEISPFSNLQDISFEANNSNSISLSSSVAIEWASRAFIDSNNDIYNGNVTFSYTIDDSERVLAQLGGLGYVGSEEVLIDSKALIFMDVDANGDEVQFNPQVSSLIISDSDYVGLTLFKMNEKGQLVSVLQTIENGAIIPVDKDGVYVVAEYSEGVYSEGVILKDEKRVAYMPIVSENINHFSTSNGKWASMLPKAETTEIEVLSPCNVFLEKQALEVKDDTFNEYEINLNAQSDLIYNIKTKVVNCEGDVEEIQAINIKVEDESFVYVFDDSEIDKWIPVCKTNFDISGSGEDLNKQGPSHSWSIDLSDELSIVSSCEEFEDGFGFIILNEEEQVYNSFEIEAGLGITSLKATTQKLRIHFDGNEERIYNENEVRIYIDDPGFGEKGYAISCENSSLGCGIEKFNVTHYEDVEGGWIRANFSGVLWAQTISPAIAGNYPIQGVILTRIK